MKRAGFKLTEHVFNAGGHPHAGNVLISSSFRIALGAIGDGLSAGPLGSASFSMDGPGDVLVALAQREVYELPVFSGRSYRMTPHDSTFSATLHPLRTPGL